MKPIVLLFLLSSALSGNAQITFKGKVVNSGMSPLPGVLVTVTGAAGRTVTDRQGNFSIELTSMDSTLIFQFAGFLSKDIRVKNWQGPIILVEDPAALDQVVIVCDNKKVPREVINRVKTELVPLYYDGQSRYYRGPFRQNKPVVTGVGTIRSNGIIY